MPGLIPPPVLCEHSLKRAILGCIRCASDKNTRDDNIIENFKKPLMVFVEYLFEVDRRTHGVSPRGGEERSETDRDSSAMTASL
jgi:hypothetical protein